MHPSVDSMTKHLLKCRKPVIETSATSSDSHFIFHKHEILTSTTRQQPDLFTASDTGDVHNDARLLSGHKLQICHRLQFCTLTSFVRSCVRMSWSSMQVFSGKIWTSSFTCRLLPHLEEACKDIPASSWRIGYNKSTIICKFRPTDIN